MPIEKCLPKKTLQGIYLLCIRYYKIIVEKIINFKYCAKVFSSLILLEFITNPEKE